MKRLVLSIVLAAVLWSVMFSPLTAPHVNFWLMMSFSALTLSVLSLRFDAGWRHEADSSWTNLLLGIVIAVALWGIFWTGDKVSTWLFDFARPQVNLIYGMKEGASPWLLSVLMLVLIGPAEEIFWRGYVQRTLSRRWTPNAGFVVTTLVYALGACCFVQLHARDGGTGGRRGVGRTLPFVSAAYVGHHRVACSVGCGGVRLVPHLTEDWLRSGRALAGRVESTVFFSIKRCFPIKKT